MELVPGRTLITWSHQLPKSSSVAILERLLGVVSLLLSHASRDFSRAGVQFARKVEELNQVLMPLEPSVEPIATELLEGSKLVQIPHGPYHGDMSFENAIISDATHEIRMVDPSTSAIQSPLIDVARLLLDCRVPWWVKGQERQDPSCSFLRELEGAVRGLLSDYAIDEWTVDQLVRMNALRILPYAAQKDAVRYEMLKGFLLNS